MASEPAEAVFARPPALSQEQEDEYRTLDREDLFGSHAPTIVNDWEEPTTLAALERSYTASGIHVVRFEAGKGEDPREWSKRRKWQAEAFFHVVYNVNFFSGSSH